MSSFPYMAIAKKHGLDYGDLLLYADSMLQTPKEARVTNFTPRWPREPLTAVRTMCARNHDLHQSLDRALRETYRNRYDRSS